MQVSPNAQFSEPQPYCRASVHILLLTGLIHGFILCVSPALVLASPISRVLPLAFLPTFIDVV